MKRRNTIEKILYAFLPDFTEETGTKEIIKKTKISYEPVYRHLKGLISSGLVKQTKKGKVDFYMLNFEKDEVRNIIERWSIKKREMFLNKFKGLKSLVRELANNLESLDPYLLSLVLFGSVARGKFTAKSDIDVLVVISAENKKDKSSVSDEIHNICSALDTQFNRTLSPLIVSLGDFCRMLDEKKNFTKNMVKDSIVLYGEGIFYRELIKRFKEWQLKIG